MIEVGDTFDHVQELLDEKRRTQINAVSELMCSANVKELYTFAMSLYQGEIGAKFEKYGKKGAI